jgi:predicted metal-dependent enzyme (double-stranded beta helix superfamily)
MEKSSQEELPNICRKWAVTVKSISGSEGRMDFFRDELPSLLANRALFEGVLKGIANGNPYPDVRQETFFDNEVILYRDPARLFSLRLYIFGASEHTAVHDHTSWGVSGSVFGKLEVVRYLREDDGSNPDQAQLARPEHVVLRPGATEKTLPFDQGIHCTGNPSEGTTLMVSVYGTPLRRLYIQRFNLENGSVHRVFSPRFRKKLLAKQALAVIERSR